MNNWATESWVWVFMGEGAMHPSAVFESRDDAQDWVAKNSLTGTLTRYPLNQPVYDWVIANDYWRPTRPSHLTPKYIGNFSSAHMDHYHFFDGVDGPPSIAKRTKDEIRSMIRLRKSSDRGYFDHG